MTLLVSKQVAQWFLNKGFYPNLVCATANI